MVFANGNGNVESVANITNRCWRPLLQAAGIRTKYRLYALRHYHASALIEEGANPKEVQAAMGHSDIKVTFDDYGHLFHDDDAKQRRKVMAERLAAGVQHELRHGGKNVREIKRRK